MILVSLAKGTTINYCDSVLPGSGYDNELVILSRLLQDTVINYCDPELPGSGYGSESQ